MGIKRIAQSQCQRLVNHAARSMEGIAVPKEGWIRTVRKALGMSGAQLGKRVGVTRGRISTTEKAETSDRVTLRTMSQLAEAMDCRFVYAIVPNSTIEETLEKRAEQKAKEIVGRASNHMALEDQSLSIEQLTYEIQRLKEEYLRKPPADFWND